tara:strand:- start:15014 stop:16168 length:1155 start_codon:yes stop_codon:yes gene_type:complete
MSKYSIYNDKIKELILIEHSNSKIAQILLKTTDSRRKNKEVDTLRTYVSRYRNKGIKDALNSISVDHVNAKHLWHEIKNDEGKKIGNAFIKNPDFKDKEKAKFEDLSKELIKELKQYSPKFVRLERVKDNDSYLLVVDPADIHIGKLASAFECGEAYNNQIAVKRVLDGVRGLLDKARGFNIDKILFIGGNDILHIDNPKRTTTSGTPQDTDGMWHTNFLIAKQLYVDVIEILLTVADVHFDFNPSNHDYTNGFFLAQVVETHFRLCENITFNTSIAHRKGFQYHNNFIGTTHGDGAKMDLLPMLFTQENTKMWCDTKHRYIYTHHVHHKTSKDYIGVTIESLRSPSGTDSWHHRNGYEHAPKAVEGFIHSKENGQVARLTHIF